MMGSPASMLRSYLYCPSLSSALVGSLVAGHQHQGNREEKAAGSSTLGYGRSLEGGVLSGGLPVGEGGLISESDSDRLKVPARIRVGKELFSKWGGAPKRGLERVRGSGLPPPPPPSRRKIPSYITITGGIRFRPPRPFTKGTALTSLVHIQEGTETGQNENPNMTYTSCVGVPVPVLRFASSLA